MANRSRHRRSAIMGNHDFLKRITKSLYYGKLPSIPCLSLPVMELSAEIFSEAQKGKSLKRLYLDDASELTRNACVSPCSLVLALLYLERLKTFNPDYVSNIAPAELFLVSLMVSNKFLQDDGEDDEVFADEWAASAGITSVSLNQLERKFLQAIDWRVFVSESNFERTLEWLEQQIALRQAKIRGWFTYTDLANINNTIENIGLLKCLATVYMALSVSYFASMCTLVASSYIVSQSFQTLTNNNHILGIFNGINYNEQISNLSNVSYVYDTISTDFRLYGNTVDEPRNVDFMLDNKNFIEDNRDEKVLYSPSKFDISNFRHLHLLFFQKFLQSSLSQCMNDTDNSFNRNRQFNATNEFGPNINYLKSDSYITPQWIKFWSKPVAC